jgi:hypothetical protein
MENFRFSSRELDQLIFIALLGLHRSARCRNIVSWPIFKSIELSPSWEVGDQSGVPDISKIIRNPNVHCRPHKSFVLVPKASPFISVHTTPCFPPCIHFNIIRPQMSFLSCCFISGVPTIILYSIFSFPSYWCCMFWKAYPVWFRPFNYTWKTM